MYLKCTLHKLSFCLFITSSSAHALNLSEAVSLAHKNDASYQMATADYMAAVEKQPQSLAAFLPTIALNIYASESTGEITTTGVTTDNDFNTNGYEISLSQTLFNKKLIDALEQSDAEVSQALANFQAAKFEMVLRATSAYFTVLAAKDNLEFARSEKQAINQQLEQSTVKFNAGLIAITDVTESQAQYDIALAQEIAAENTLMSAQEELHTLIDVPIENIADLNPAIPLLTPEPEDINQWQNKASENNLALRAAYYAVVAATQAVSGSKAEHYPTLNLNLTHQNDSADGSTFGSAIGGRDTEATRLSLNLEMPIYSGGFTNSKHRESIARLDKVKAELTNQKRITIQETRNAFRGITAAIAQAQALKKALESTKSASEATQAGFDAGTRNSVDVLFAQREQYKSARDYSRALYDYILNVLALKKSAGILSEIDIQQINQWLIAR